MPYYEFITESGEKIRKYLDSSRAPQPKKTYVFDGVKCRRSENTPNFVVRGMYPSPSLPLWTSGADSYLDDGTPCFQSDKTAERACSNLGYVERKDH